MLHACVEKFDVTGTVGKKLGTKRGLTLVKEWALPPGPTTRMAIRHALLFSAKVEEAGPKISWIDPTPVKVKQSEFSDKILKV